MSKWLNWGINCLIVFFRFGIVAAYVMLIYPLSDLLLTFQRKLPQNIMHSDDFLRLPGQNTVTAGAIQSFPSWPYAILILIGTLIFIWAMIKNLKSLIIILKNIQQADYFSITNEKALKQLVIANVVIIVSDLFLAGGNQLTRSWFYLINNEGILSSTWGTIVSDVWHAIILGVIYVVYHYALTLKTENDLTI